MTCKTCKVTTEERPGHKNCCICIMHQDGTLVHKYPGYIPTCNKCKDNKVIIDNNAQKDIPCPECQPRNKDCSFCSGTKKIRFFFD